MKLIKSVSNLWITILSLGLFTSLCTVEGFLNVFIDQHEMVKLMGLDAELFYVRHGIVNNFALSFVVPVPEQVDDLTFSWQRLVDVPIPYSISIEYESQLGGLLTPHINVPVRGHVPSALSTFTIRLPCTGNVSEEVPVGIHLEIDGYPHFNHTKLTFKRNKICIKDENFVEKTKSSAIVFKLVVFAFTFLLVSSVILVTCYCRGSSRLSNKVEKCHEPSPQTSYTIDESSSCSASASSSLSSRCTTTTTAKSTSHKQPPLPQMPQLHSQLHYGQQQQQLCGEYGNVPSSHRRHHFNSFNKDRHSAAAGRGIAGCHRPPSVASCSSIYETIVESVNKFPMQTMHSNKTCGACCSLFGDTTLYDGVTIAGLVLPTTTATTSSTNNSATKSRDRRSMAAGGAASSSAAIYDQPDVEATIRWPAPPLFTLEDEQRQSNQPSTTMMVRVKQQQQQNAHCYTNSNSNSSNSNVNRQKLDTRFNTAPGGVGGFDGNPFVGTGSSLWNADVGRRYDDEDNNDGKESCTYYEPTSTFVNQHL